MEIKFNFSVDGWLETKVEGESLAACKEKLMKMSLREMIENGYVKDFSISNIDQEITEASYEIHVTSIDYDIYEYEIAEDDNIDDLYRRLPQALDLTIKYIQPKDLLDNILNEIEYQTNYRASDCIYEIKKIF